MTEILHPQTRRSVLASALAMGGGAAELEFASIAGASDMPGGLRTGDVHDFDFLHGDWTFQNRRLKKRWVGSDDWDEFPATMRCEGHMGGMVNVDENLFPARGFSGMTIRTFSLARRQWFIYWISSSQGDLLPPVVGGFTGDRGEFYGEDTDDGRPIKARFIWTRLSPDTARWEQAFSLDGEAWETNWVMDHTRVRA
jgi:hypothetical protein